MSDKSLQATASRLIRKRGRPGVRLSRSQQGSGGTAWKPEAAAPLVLAANLFGVFTEPRAVRGSQGEFGLEVLLRTDTTDPGSLTPASTAILYLAPADLPPGVTVQPGDRVEEPGGKRFAVLRADLLQPGSLPILLTLYLKE